jgi:hypothetical protein
MDGNRNTDYPPHSSSPKPQKDSVKSNKISKSTVNSGETMTAMEKAQNMLNKYGKGGTAKAGKLRTYSIYACVNDICMYIQFCMGINFCLHITYIRISS